MPSSQDALVLVHSRRTGLIDVRRANAFSDHPRLAKPDYTLHYIGTDRSRVCQCTNRSQHYEKTIEVASEATHLNVSLMMYLTRHGFESCTIAAFRKYMKDRKSMWRKQGVNIDTFHYMNDSKNMICRCVKRASHNACPPRNPEIIEQCAEFFITHKDAMTCRKSQWQAVEGDTPPLYSPLAPPPICPETTHSPGLPKPPYSPDSQKDAFEYDSISTHKLLQQWNTRNATSPEMKVRSTAEPLTPICSRCPPTGPRGEPDVPTKVWQSAHPSVWIPLHGSNSAVTTPLGTSFSRSSVSARPATLATEPEPFGNAQRMSASTNWSDVQNNADVPNVNLTRKPRVSSFYTTQRPAKTGLGISRAQEQEFRLNNSQVEPHVTSVAELPGQLAAVELGAEPLRQAQHHNIMPKVHGKVLELPGKQSSFQTSQTSANVSTSTKQSPRLSLLLEQVHDIIRLPGQEELLLRHAVVLQTHHRLDRQKRTIMLPDCEHFIHEECLLESFRMRDQRIGTCPTCNVGLCERTLADRIDTDRITIFGSQFTRLRNQVSVDFPQHNEAVTCASEEEVAAAQLRLIKDYVDVHSEETFRMWELNRAEPDWFMAIVRPVVKLFQAWDIPDRESRYFVGHEAFLKLLAWAELVRLMNHGRKASQSTQGVDSAYPQLGELHRKFALALERYDKEKLLWGKDQGRIPDCDCVAQDVVDLALRTQTA
ncbi:hypothetical protein T440DRAFT_493514 [Plenodomus tracheiphilus IPT5]|uniref:Uncharacterized protein n=1 Tax=Plenodomus tracheiphilus IPT5 TaxID=1408161 RepID=A0A6A7APS9_9PLEO|nr:hypothetical protein T440DRAFT_493514 [Plenodomus tracheiphilus IPT5]